MSRDSFLDELDLFSHYFDFDRWSSERALYDCANSGCCVGRIKTDRGYTLICIRCGAEVEDAQK